MVDSRASGISTIGYGQFIALKEAQGRGTKLQQPLKETIIKFRIRVILTISILLINILLIGRVIFYIIYIDTPFLLSLVDIKRLRIYYNSNTNKMIILSREVPVIVQNRHIQIRQNLNLKGKVLTSEPFTIYLTTGFTYSCYLTKVELRRLHRRYSHLLVARLDELLRRIGHSQNRTILDIITKHYDHY